MFDLKKFEELIIKLEENNIDYYVFGRFSVNCMRNFLDDNYGDIDFLINKKDKRKFLKVLSNLGWKEFIHKTKRYKLRGEIFDIDCLFFRRNKHKIDIKGARGDFKINSEIFQPVRVKIEKLDFNSVPLLFHVKRLQYLEKEEDRKFLFNELLKIPKSDLVKIKLTEK